MVGDPSPPPSWLGVSTRPPDGFVFLGMLSLSRSSPFPIFYWRGAVLVFGEGGGDPLHSTTRKPPKIGQNSLIFSSQPKLKAGLGWPKPTH